MNHSTFIGLDVHAQTVAACALDTTTGQIQRAKMSSEPAVVCSWIQRFPADAKVVYEAGPTGYALARHLLAHGIDCVIAAPSKLLRAPGDHVKTDQRDAQSLARILSLGEITEVRIPSEEQEALRDLSRARAQVQRAVTRARQHLNALLLRHGMRYPEATRWTAKHLHWLHQQRFAQPATQLAFDAELESLELLAAHLARLEKSVAELAQHCDYTPVINALMCLRGISTTTAFGLAVEIGDWTRFTGPSICSYLGLVPSEHSSGPKRSQGPIAKAGNTHARKLLVEAAWHHKRPFTRPGERLRRQLDLVDPATRCHALKGNRRLANRWKDFELRGKLPVKANTAIARELAAWCWALAAPLQAPPRPAAPSANREPAK